MINTGFTFDGVTSTSMGVSIVRTSGGLIQTPYVASRNIYEDYPPRAIAPYFFRTQAQPLSFTLTMTCIDDDMDSTKLQAIASWLFQNEYKPFISDDNTNKIYYVIATNQADFMTNGFDEGYFEIQFRCQHAYALTVGTTPTYDSPYGYSQSTPVTQFTIHNDNNVYQYHYPIYEITVGATPTEIYIYNHETDQNVLFGQLDAEEVLYVDNQKKYIISDTGNYRYGDFNKEWLYLVQGDNLIEIRGICSIKFNLQYPIWT